MALFVDLDDDDDADSPRATFPGVKPVWSGNGQPFDRRNDNSSGNGARHEPAAPSTGRPDREEAHEPAVRENPKNRSSMTEALGCYPVIMAVAAHIDLNTLDSLSRTCRLVRAALLQYRSMLVKSTLHCSNEDIPVDPEDTLRYRARAGNWFYMEDTSRTGNYNGKAGDCARDMVSECRRCETVVCRNCAIKPPAPIVLRERLRRLCAKCQKMPIGHLVKPRMSPNTPLDCEEMQRAMCACATDGVWLCQPCGRGIRGHDSDYQGIWKWRNQYGEVLGGLGTGIGDADRGVECARKGECCARKHIEQETDCDAEDAREAERFASGSSPGSESALALYGGSGSWSSHSSLQSLHSPSAPGDATPSGMAEAVAAAASRRTPSPALGPGYARHEIEGIGGIVKRKRLKMVRVGACVPEWEDERARGEVLGREVSGRVRSWCDWCWRVVPGKKDHDLEKGRRDSE